MPSASGVGLGEIRGEPGVITIVDDDALPTVSLESLGQVNEPHPRGHIEMRKNTSLTVTVRLSGALESTVTVSLLATNESAEDDDYTISPASVTILPGATVAEFTLSALRNNLQQRNIEYFEGTEILTLEPVAIIAEGLVRLPTDGSVPHQVAISESLPVPELEVIVNGGPTSFNEGQQRIELVAVPDDVTEFTVTLTLRRRADSTAGDTDFELESDTVEIGPGSVAFLYLDIIDDVIYEGDETLIFEGYATGGGIELPVRPLVTEIIDNNDPRPTLRIGEVGPLVNEGESLTFTVEVVGSANYSQTLTFRPIFRGGEGGAEAADLRSPLPDFTIAVPADRDGNSPIRRFEFTIRTNQDSIYENTELFNFELILRDNNGVVRDRYDGFVDIMDDEPIPTISPLNVPLSEGESQTLEIVFESAASVDVTLTLVLENAVEGVTAGDYSLTPSDVFISAGMTSAVVSLLALDDSDREGEERFDLRLVSASSGVTVAVGSVVMVTIEASDQPVDITPGVEIVTPTISPLNVPLSEGESQTLEIVLESAASVDVTLTLVLENAVEGVTAGDYSLTPTAVFISAGMTSAMVSLLAYDDPDREDEERFDLRLVSASSGVTVAVGSVVTVTIIDDDEAPVVPELPEVVVVTATLRVSELSVSEGDTTTLNIELSEAASEDVTLTLTVVGGSAVESVDYEPLLVPVVIRAGVLELTVSIRTIEDDLTEATETLVLELSVLSGPAVTGAVDRVTVTITDDDEAPVVPELPEVVVVTATLRVSELSVSEGDTATLNIELSEAASEDVTLTLTVVAGGSAVESVDYEPLLVPVVIRAGVLELTVSIRTIEDDLTEATETLVLVLSVLSGPAVTGSVDRVTVTITDDDEAPVVPELPEVVVVTATLRVSELSVSEGDTATLNIELSEAASEDVTLTLTVVGGSAVESVDYEPLFDRSD